MAKVAGYWPLGDSLVDLSGNGFNGTATNAPVAPGKFGPARYIDGTSGSYITLGQVPTQEKLAISCWIKWDSLTTGGDANGLHALVQKRDSGVNGVWSFIYYDPTHTTTPNVLAFWFYYSSWFGKISTTFYPKVGIWYHLVVSCDVRATSGTQFWVNGIRLGTQHDNSVANWTTTPTQNLTVGYTANSNSSFKGWVHELTVYPRMLSSAEVEAYYLNATKQAISFPTIFKTGVPVEKLLSEGLTLTDTLSRDINVTRTFAETFTIADTVNTQITRFRPLAEALTLTDTLAWDKERYTYTTEDLTIADTLDSQLVVTRAIDESLTIQDTLDKELNVSRTLAETLTLADTLSGNKISDRAIDESLTLTDTVTHQLIVRLWQSYNIFNELELLRVYGGSVALVNNLKAPIFLSTNFRGTALQLTNTIYSSVFSSQTLRVGLTNHNYLYLNKRLANNIVPLGHTSVITPEYRVLLDGRDVTNKVESCTISYGLGDFVGEVDIAWADYSLFDEISIMDLPKNYAIERLAVYTRLNSNDSPEWILQGKFFIEKRGTTIGPDSIIPTSWGRSRPALLALPYAMPVTRVWSADTTAASVARELCAYYGVNINWEVVDYRVIAGNLTADGSEPIELISTLAAAVGGVLTCSNDGTLQVRYRYNLTSKVDAEQVPPVYHQPTTPGV